MLLFPYQEFLEEISYRYVYDMRWSKSIFLYIILPLFVYYSAGLVRPDVYDRNEARKTYSMSEFEFNSSWGFIFSLKKKKAIENFLFKIELPWFWFYLERHLWIGTWFSTIFRNSIYFSRIVIISFFIFVYPWIIVWLDSCWDLSDNYEGLKFQIGGKPWEENDGEIITTYYPPADKLFFQQNYYSFYYNWENLYWAFKNCYITSRDKDINRLNFVYSNTADWIKMWWYINNDIHCLDNCLTVWCSKNCINNKKIIKNLCLDINRYLTWKELNENIGIRIYVIEWNRVWAGPTGIEINTLKKNNSLGLFISKDSANDLTGLEIRSINVTNALNLEIILP